MNGGIGSVLVETISPVFKWPKDALMHRIYGARGANSVIIVLPSAVQAGEVKGRL